MMTYQEREKVRGTMKPQRELSEAQLREIADRARFQAEEYYALADKVASGSHVNDVRYLEVVSLYFGDN